MEKNINYYKKQFKTLVEEMCKEMQVNKAKVYIGYDQYSILPSSCDIDFED